MKTGKEIEAGTVLASVDVPLSYPGLLGYEADVVTMLATGGSNTEAIGYVGRVMADVHVFGTLYVVFKGGRVYRYFNVPGVMAEELLRTAWGGVKTQDSTGSLLNSLVIRPKDYEPFKCERVR